MKLTGNQLKDFGFPDGGTHTGNAGRRAHLQHLKNMREGNASGPRKLGTNGGFAGVLLSIPELDYYCIVQRFPDLRSPDHEIKRKAWLKFHNDPASEKYRVHRKKRGEQCRSITAR